MTIYYNVTGDARKQLVYTMAELLECRPLYLKAPTYAYQVSDYTVSKDGEVRFNDRTADSEEVEMLIERLAERGFEPEAAVTPKREHPKQTGEPEHTEDVPHDDVPITDLVVSLPLYDFDVGSLIRLHALIASKRTLLQKALGIELLPVQVTEDRVSFPWFHGEIDGDHVKAYTELIGRICAMAKNSKRITARDTGTNNDKYAFRCFLLRLGFIGSEYKRTRKILLERLDGSAAFRYGAPKPQTSPTLGAESEVQE